MNVLLLTTAEECDSFQGELEQGRDDLVLRKSNLLSQQSNFSKNANTVGEELVNVEARMAAADIIIGALPEGPEREKEETNKSKLNWRVKTLKSRKGNYSKFALMELEVKVEELDARIGVYNSNIAKVIARKGQLTA